MLFGLEGRDEVAGGEGGYVGGISSCRWGLFAHMMSKAWLGVNGRPYVRAVHPQPPTGISHDESVLAYTYLDARSISLTETLHRSGPNTDCKPSLYPVPRLNLWCVGTRRLLRSTYHRRSPNHSRMKIWLCCGVYWEVDSPFGKPKRGEAADQQLFAVPRKGDTKTQYAPPKVSHRW